MKVKRSQKTTLTLAAMSERLELIRIALNQNKAQFADGLGYANPSPLTRIGKSTGFIGPDKLHRLATMQAPDGSVPNINWLLTGLGPMLIEEKYINTSRGSDCILTKEEIAKVIADTVDHETLKLLINRLAMVIK